MHFLHLPALNIFRSVFLYTEVDSASEAFHGYPLVLQHTFAIHAKFSLDISQLARPPPAHVDGSPETMPPPSPAGRWLLTQAALTFKNS